ncbi:MAG TPA: PAS domain-containing sensor histidine kinase [Planctomycetota bacterium]|nr:PAS domain-containing sensor histidine kinase [Planctomycetota bacterium]
MDGHDLATPELILEALPVGIWTTDAEGRILYQNPAAKKILEIERGVPLETFAPKAWAWNSLRPIPPGEWVWHRTMKSGGAVLAEVVALETETGPLKTVILSAVPVFKGGGSLEHVVVVAVDCSSLVSAHESLRRMISLRDATLEASTNGILVIDLDGRIVIHNRMFERIWAIPRDVLETGEDTRALEVALAQVKDPVAFLAKVRELYAQPLERSFDTIEFKDGRVFERVSIPQLLDGAPVGRVWSFADVTARKREEIAREEALEAERHARAEAEQTRERLRVLADVSQSLANAIEDPDAIAVAARAAVPMFADWCVLDEPADGSAIRRLVVAQADPVLEPLARVLEGFPPRPDALVGAGHVLRTGVPEVFSEIPEGWAESIARTPEHLAALKVVGIRSALIVPLSARGRVFGTMSFAQSSSGRRFGRADLSFAQDLAARVGLALDNARLYQRKREALKARDEVLSVVSHDLRNPLAAIRAAAGLVLRGLDSPETAQRLTRRNLDIIVRTAVRMDTLIERLLDVARIDARKLPIEARPEDPAEILRVAIEQEQPLAIGKRINLLVEIDSPLRPILANRDRLHAVFENLMGNAIKFTPEGGRIVVGARLVGGSVRFTITDSGPGISDADLPHIFERFWRAKNSAGMGVGLGLAIAKGIVEAHGGEIRVQNVPGAGASFSFTIPCAPSLERRAA